MYLATILVTGSSVEASGRAELMTPGSPFWSLCPHRFHCAQAVVALGLCMSSGSVWAVMQLCSIACPNIQNKKMWLEHSPAPSNPGCPAFLPLKRGGEKRLGNNLSLSGHEAGLCPSTKVFPHPTVLVSQGLNWLWSFHWGKDHMEIMRLCFMFV